MKTWPHAPSKAVSGSGAYIITASTYQELHHFHDEESLTLLHDCILETAQSIDWRLEAWAIFSNRYHIVGESPLTENPVLEFTKAVHQKTGYQINRKDNLTGRTIWHRSWDTKITFEKSYLARLAYVHNNPVWHGLVADAKDYPWCSAKWFSLKADKPFYETVMSFKTNSVKVFDEF